MFYQIFLSPQVKRWAIITYKHGIYELPHELPDELRLRKLVKGIFAAGGGLCPHTHTHTHTHTHKKTQEIRKNREVPKSHKMIA